MQDQDMPDPGRVLDEMQRCVLCVLLAPTGRGLCSMHELAVAVGDHEAAELAVVGLHAEGLVHRLDGFVFATRPVARAHELDVLGGRPSF
ncbi:MAG TPA: hypothetical protein VG053_03525 [Solirubrobacteraceae bacterium]|jgi:hypothetical protein|nr:hypothetical protein [Solirubrobacteraceae bacterium]